MSNNHSSYPRIIADLYQLIDECEEQAKICEEQIGFFSDYHPVQLQAKIMVSSISDIYRNFCRSLEEIIKDYDSSPTTKNGTKVTESDTNDTKNISLYQRVN